MNKSAIIVILLLIGNEISAQKAVNYVDYHQEVVGVENLLAEEKYDDALQAYEQLFEQYDFVFLRDYQLATQIAWYLGKEEKTAELLSKGMRAGWTMKSIKKNSFLDEFRQTSAWEAIQPTYRSLQEDYQASLDQELRKQVKKMFSRDQRKALGALLVLSDKGYQRYAEKRFAPHSNRQLKEFEKIMEKAGYPGEKRIGNHFWMSTILSHHNSTTPAVVQRDTLYPKIKPALEKALAKGELSAFEFILIEEWYRVSVAKPECPLFGILDGPLEVEVDQTNDGRKAHYLRSIEVHNRLVDLSEKTGMNFYLEGNPWSRKKIEIR